ncbi:hypothetical protein K7432_000843 [Basidiobolus ranarum]|uniref:Uncharacterized protein n=1 Tax=Basidiobolus ranarum TaxID=34480 RepID=A0ABR2WAH3_9FUNG
MSIGTQPLGEYSLLFIRHLREVQLIISTFQLQARVNMYYPTFFFLLFLPGAFSCILGEIKCSNTHHDTILYCVDNNWKSITCASGTSCKVQNSDKLKIECEYDYERSSALNPSNSSPTYKRVKRNINSKVGALIEPETGTVIR